MAGAASTPISPRSMSNIFDDIFGDFMGGGAGRGGRRAGRERGADLRYNMEISLEEAYAGSTAEIEVPSKIVCKTCSGNGARRGSSPRTCTTCDGHGRVRAAAGLLLDRAHLPRLPRPRRGDHRSLPGMLGRRPRHRGAHALGQHSRRYRGRHPHPACRRGRGGPARRSVGRPLHLSLDQAARASSSATAPTSSAGCRFP